MSGTINAVFRPDVTDYGMPPQNRLAPQPTWADAATYNAQAVSDYIAQQRAKSEQMGLWDSSTGLPTGAGVVNAAQQYGSGMLMGTTAPGIRAFHGSPADFSRFNDRFIGTGEGVQAYGRGHYFGDAESTGLSYRDALTTKQPSPELIAAQNAYNKAYNAVGDVTGGTQQDFNAAIAARDAARENMERVKAEWEAQPKPQGHMYEVNINADPEQFLHWDKPLSEQSPHVQKALSDFVEKEAAYKARYPNSPMGDPLGSNIYQSSQLVPGDYRDAAAAAQELQKRGIPGIRYLDQGSRGAGEGTHNYVVFDANTIDILRKYGLAGLGIGLSGAAAGTQQQSQ